MGSVESGARNLQATHHSKSPELPPEARLGCKIPRIYSITTVKSNTIAALVALLILNIICTIVANGDASASFVSLGIAIAVAAGTPYGEAQTLLFSLRGDLHIPRRIDAEEVVA